MLILAQMSDEEAISAARALGDSAVAQVSLESVMDWLNRYSLLLVVAFLVTLVATPLVRRAALAANLVDQPDARRKLHRSPVAYLGGIAVFFGLMIAVGISYVAMGDLPEGYSPVPWSILVGIVAITATGLADDIWGWDPRLKIAGQLVAAAALAIEDVGTRVAEGVLKPLFDLIQAGDGSAEWVVIEVMQLTNGDIYYWVGTALIAIFVLGGCNAANLLDGMDGLLSGSTAIMAVGLLSISLLLAVTESAPSGDEPSIAAARIVLCFALLGTVLGFLPHNFNPATIFLGDCGSLLIGYITVAIILMLGHNGETHLVFAGLIVFALPIMDTTLAIVRRKLRGKSLSQADDQHIHHQMLRAVGGVKRAVFALYGIGTLFAVVGVLLAILVVQGPLRIRVVYAIAIVLFGFIGAIAFKTGRRQELEAETARIRRRNGTTDSSGPEAGKTRPSGPESQVAAPGAPSSTTS